MFNTFFKKRYIHWLCYSILLILCILVSFVFSSISFQGWIEFISCYTDIWWSEVIVEYRRLIHHQWFKQILTCLNYFFLHCSRSECWFWEKIHSQKCLLHKYEDLSSIPRYGNMHFFCFFKMYFIEKESHCVTLPGLWLPMEMCLTSD